MELQVGRSYNRPDWVLRGKLVVDDDADIRSLLTFDLEDVNLAELVDPLPPRDSIELRVDPPTTARVLRAGATFRFATLRDLRDYEARLVERCQRLRDLLTDVASDSGGQTYTFAPHRQSP